MHSFGNLGQSYLMKHHLLRESRIVNQKVFTSQDQFKILSAPKETASFKLPVGHCSGLHFFETCGLGLPLQMLNAGCLEAAQTQVIVLNFFPTVPHFGSH